MAATATHKGTGPQIWKCDDCGAEFLVVKDEKGYDRKIMLAE